MLKSFVESAKGHIGNVPAKLRRQADEYSGWLGKRAGRWSLVAHTIIGLSICWVPVLLGNGYHFMTFLWNGVLFRFPVNTLLIEDGNPLFLMALTISAPVMPVYLRFLNVRARTWSRVCLHAALSASLILWLTRGLAENTNAPLPFAALPALALMLVVLRHRNLFAARSLRTCIVVHLLVMALSALPLAYARKFLHVGMVDGERVAWVFSNGRRNVYGRVTLAQLEEGVVAFVHKDSLFEGGAYDDYWRRFMSGSSPLDLLRVIYVP